MIEPPTQTTKLRRAREDFFRPAVMQNPSPVSLDIELMARPLSFRFILLTLATMIIIALVYLSNVDYASTFTTQGETVHARDRSLQFVVVLLPETVHSINLGDRATVRFDAFLSDTYGAIEATIISIESIRKEVPGFPRVQMALQLDQDFLETPDRKIPLQAGLSGNAQLVVREKSLLGWIIQYLRPREEP